VGSNLHPGRACVPESFLSKMEARSWPAPNKKARTPMPPFFHRYCALPSDVHKNNNSAEETSRMFVALRSRGEEG